MSEAPETKEQQRVYCTNALLRRVGRAIAISLEDATLPGNAKNKHMVIFYRRHKHFTENEIELMSRECDNWIRTQYGHNTAPVTFTINTFGHNSVRIEGDLYDLCIYLRNKFPSMSNDKQRIPHCKIYVKGANKNKNKCCHICGDETHYKRNCPQREYKKDKNMKHKLEFIMNKVAEIKQQKLNEIKLLDEQTEKLQMLYNNMNNFDNKTLNNQIKNIANEFKFKKKEMKQYEKCVNKRRKSERKEMKCKRKQQKKAEKMQRKMEKYQRKLEKKQAKHMGKEAETLECNQPTNDEFIDVKDEIEGYNDDMIDMDITNDNDCDYEFTTIFGEDMNMINID